MCEKSCRTNRFQRSSVYQISQIMNPKQAKTILENYRTGECSPEERRLVEQWYAQLVETGEWQWSDEDRMQLQQAMKCVIAMALAKSL